MSTKNKSATASHKYTLTLLEITNDKIEFVESAETIFPIKEADLKKPTSPKHMLVESEFLPIIPVNKQRYIYYDGVTLAVGIQTAFELKWRFHQRPLAFLTAFLQPVYFFWRISFVISGV